MVIHMRIDPNAQIAHFLQTVISCKGEVIYQTTEGDRLNLKSQLCQYIFAAIATKPELLEQGEVVCSFQEDARKLQEFCLYSEEGEI